MKKGLGVALVVVAAGFCLLWYLPYFQNQFQIGFFAYTRTFARAFFEGGGFGGLDGFGGGFGGFGGGFGGFGGSGGESQGLVEATGLHPRIGEFLWRFVSQFYINIGGVLLAAGLVTTAFCRLSWAVLREYTLLALPVFFYFFTSPEPTVAAWSMYLLLGMGLLALCVRGFRRLGRSLGRKRGFRRSADWGWGRLAGALAAFACVPVFVFCFHHNPLERNLLQVRQAATVGNYERCFEISDRVCRERAGVSLDEETEEVKRQRVEMTAWLKLSLLQTGRLNNMFLDYDGVPLMGGMFASDFPYEQECAYPYVLLQDCLGIYAPQVPFILSVFEKKGWQNRFVKPLLRAELHTGQGRLLQKSLRYAARTVAYRKVALDGAWASALASSEDGSRPVPLQSASLVRGGNHLDGWVKLYAEGFPGKPAEFSVPLLDYYTLLCLLDKRLDRVEFLAEQGARLGCKTLPAYMQEAVCFMRNYPSSLPRKQMLETPYMGYHLSLNVLEEVEEVYRAWALYHNGKMDFVEASRLYRNTFTYRLYFL